MSKESITVEAPQSVTESFRRQLRCKDESETVEKLLNCMQRLRQSEKKTQFDDALERMVMQEKD